MVIVRHILNYIFCLKHIETVKDSYISASRMFQKALDLLRKALWDMIWDTLDRCLKTYTFWDTLRQKEHWQNDRLLGKKKIHESLESLIWEWFNGN